MESLMTTRHSESWFSLVAAASLSRYCSLAIVGVPVPYCPADRARQLRCRRSQAPPLEEKLFHPWDCA